MQLFNMDAMAADQVRSTAVRVALGLHWAAVLLLILGARLLAGVGGHPLIGTTLVVGAIGVPAGWFAALLALRKDRGRIRLGAAVLVGYPLLASTVWLIGLGSTQARMHDPLLTLTWLIVGLGLGLATLLICLPSELGTD